MRCPSAEETTGRSGFGRREDIAALHQLLAYVDARRPELVFRGADAQTLANAEALLRTLRTQLALAQGYLKK